ncbi:MAG: hypothetical protein WCF54_08140 [Terracidiphilus sp.]
MTISSTSRVAGPFTGSGSAATFPFTFKVFEATDLFVVTLNVATGTMTTLTLTTDYTATLNANQDSSPGGSITLTAGNLANGLTLTITTAIAALQNLDLLNGGAFYPDTINQALDWLTVLIQQLQTTVKRSLQIPIVDSAPAVTLPAAAERAGNLLGFDVNGVPEVVSIGEIIAGQTVAIPFSSTPVFSVGSGSQLKITLTGNVTSSTFTAGSTANIFVVFKIHQDSVGGHTFTWPANLHNAGMVNPAANSTSTQLFAIDTDGSATAVGPILYS